jgi:phage-related protein
MFKGVDFIFDGVPSETYGVKIGAFNLRSPEITLSGLQRSIEEYRIKRRSKPIFQGVEIREKLEFDLLLFSEVEIDTYDRQFIDSWLHQQNYRFFSIVQSDFEGLYFNCIITSSEKVEVGNIPYAKMMHVVCDDAYVYSNEYEYNFTSTSTPKNVEIRSRSNINDYLYVEDMTITTTSATTVKITNNTDNTRLFEITGLSSGETITVDNDNKILTSSNSNNRVGNFNKKWFRLLPQKNIIRLEGNFNLNMKIRYKMTI